MELNEYDIEFRARTCAKSQVLADFLVELPRDIPETKHGNGVWTLNVEDASSKQGSGVGIHMVSPHGEVIEQSFRLDFVASNNEAEYEALIARMQLAKACGAKKVSGYCDSQLVANQFSEELETRDECMEAYVKVVRYLAKTFETFELIRIPQGDNSSADALAILASTSDPRLTRIIPV